MYDYHAFNLNIRSDFEIRGLPAIEGSPEAFIRIRTIPKGGVESRQPNTSQFVGWLFGRLIFTIEEGRFITLYSNPADSELQAEELGRAGLGVLLALMMRQRGALVLHAGVVRKGRNVLAFMGASGSGKSTITEQFSRQGYSVIDDDLLVIDFRDEGPVVIPGIPRIKIRPDIGPKLCPDFNNLPEVHRNTRKRVLSFQAERGKKTYSLSRIYVINTDWKQENQIVPIGPQEKMKELLRNSFTAKFDSLPEMKVRHFRQCTQLAKSVSMSRLHRVRSLQSFPELLYLVEEDLEVREKPGPCRCD